MNPLEIPLPNNQTMTNAFGQAEEVELNTICITIIINISFALLCLFYFWSLRQNDPGHFNYKRKWLPRACPPDLPSGFFSWIPPLLRMSEKEVLKYAGFDATILLRFYKMAFKIFAIFSFYGLTVIVPVNVASGAKQSGNVITTINTFGQLSMSNIQHYDSKMWVHAAGLYLLTALTLYYLYVEFRFYKELRHEYLIRRAPHLRTIVVEGVPLSMRTSPKLHTYFSTLYPGAVASVYVPQDLWRLRKHIDRRLRVLARLEGCIANKQACGAERYHRLGMFGFGPKVNSIDIYSRSLERLNTVIQQEQATACQQETVFFYSGEGYTGGDNQHITLQPLQYTEFWRRNRLLPNAKGAGPIERAILNSYAALQSHQEGRGHHRNGEHYDEHSSGNRDESFGSFSISEVTPLTDVWGAVRNGLGALGEELNEEDGLIPDNSQSSITSANTLHNKHSSIFDNLRLDFIGDKNKNKNKSKNMHENTSIRDEHDVLNTGEKGFRGWIFSHPSVSSATTTVSTTLPVVVPVDPSTGKLTPLFNNELERGVDTSKFTDVHGKLIVTPGAESETEPLLNGRRKREPFSAGSRAFVTFKTFAAATTARQVLHCGRPRRMSARSAPEPRDVVWENIIVGRRAHGVRRFFVEVILACLMVFFPVIVTLLSYAVSADQLIDRNEVIYSLCNQSSLFRSAVQLIQPLCLIILMSVLPILLEWLGTLEGIISQSQNQITVMSRLFLFQIINVFLVTTIAGSLFDVVNRIANHPSDTFTLLGETLPRVSGFFCDFIIIRAFSTTSMELIRLPAYVIDAFRHMCGVRGKTSVPFGLRSYCNPGCFYYSNAYAQDLLVLTLIMTYACISPLVLIPGMIFFGYAHLIYRHQLLYIYVPVFESGASFFPRVFRRIIFALFTAQATMIGMFILKNGINQMYAVSALMVITFVYKTKMRDMYEPVAEALPLELAVALDLGTTNAPITPSAAGSSALLSTSSHSANPNSNPNLNSTSCNSINSLSSSNRGNFVKPEPPGSPHQDNFLSEYLQPELCAPACLKPEVAVRR